MNRARLPVTLLAALVLAGCAAQAPVELPPAPVAVPAAPAPAPAPAPGTPGDTVPSPAALAVLASIPDPVPAPPPLPPARGHVTVPPVAPAPAAVAPDTSVARRAVEDSTIAPGDTVAVPVPAPTTALGAGAAPVMPPTPPPAAPPPAVAASVSAARDTCWRVQVGAPTERARGQELLAVAQSQLMLPMVVSHEAGRWKVRTRDCFPRESAEDLRARAIATGFKGVFLVRYAGAHP